MSDKAITTLAVVAGITLAICMFFVSKCQLEDEKSWNQILNPAKQEHMK